MADLNAIAKAAAETIAEDIAEGIREALSEAGLLQSQGTASGVRDIAISIRPNITQAIHEYHDEQVRALVEAAIRCQRSLGYYLDFHEQPVSDYNGDGANRLMHAALASYQEKTGG